MTSAIASPPKERPILFSEPMVRAILADQKTVTRRVMKPQAPTNDAVVKRTGGGVSIASCTWGGRPEDFVLCGDVGVAADMAGLPFIPDWRCPYGQPGDRLWVRESSLYRSECGKFLCRMHGGGCGEAWTADGKTHWVNDTSNSNRPQPFCVGGYSCAMNGQKKGSFTLNLLRCNPRKKIIPLTGNTIIESQDVVFRKMVPGIHMPRWACRINLEITDVRAEALQEIENGDARDEGFVDSAVRRNGGGIALDKFRELWDELNGPRGFGWDANPWVWVVSFKRIEGQS